MIISNQSPVTPWEVFALATTFPSASWFLLVNPIAPNEDLIDTLLDAFESKQQLVSYEPSSVQEFIDISKQHCDVPLIFRKLYFFSKDDFIHLDHSRSSLERKAQAFMVLSVAQTQLLFEVAPNFQSWFTGSCWYLKHEEDLSNNQREKRLDSLRKHYQLEDNYVITAAEQNTLPADPDFAEWLILLGKGHLIPGSSR